MDNFIIFMLTLCGAIAVLLIPTIWLYYRDETQKRDKSHLERLKSLELGIPLPDAQVARISALRWIGTAVPLGALAAAVTATQMLLPLQEYKFFAWLLATIWGTCGLVCVVAIATTIGRLREAGEQGRQASYARRENVAGIQPNNV